MIDTLSETQTAEAYFANKNKFSTGPVEVSKKIKSHEDMVLVDVRDEDDFLKGHIPGAINLPQSEWATLQGLRKDTTNILYCYSQTCHLASQAGQFFAGKGYPVIEMDGGFEAWTEKQLELEP